MKRLFEGVSPPPPPPPGARPGEPMVVFHSRSMVDGEVKSTTYWLTRKEAAAAGYREVTHPEGHRIVQFGLCRDDRGEWIYPPFKKSDETVDEMLERNREARHRMDRCPKKRNAAGERQWQ